MEDLQSHPVTPEPSLINRYFDDLWRIIRHPKVFFRNMPTHGGLSGPLTFALVTHWLSASFTYLWNLALGIGKTGGILNWIMNSINDSTIHSDGRAQMMLEFKERTLQWLGSAGSVLLDPFFTLSGLLFSSFFVFIGARILIDSKPDRPSVRFETICRILCFSASPAILAALPWVGPIFATFGVLIVTVLGIREVFQVRTRRAITVAVFPKLMFFGIIFMGMVFFGVLLMKWISYLI